MGLKIFKCTRCGYEWASHKPEPPKYCANKKCRSPYWSKPKVKNSGPQAKEIDFEDVVYCHNCDQVVEEPEPIYECGSCGNTFSRSNSADGWGHSCPDCYKWGSKVSDIGCPDCQEEAEEEEAGECPYCEQTILKSNIEDDKCPECGKKLQLKKVQQ